MATYKEIQEYIKITYDFTPKTCWIAHMKELVGLERKVAVNRINVNRRTNPCPEDKKKYIGEAFRHFGMF